MPKEIKLFDTLTAKKQVFVPRSPGKVTIYCCGPTVYGYTHIGNAAAALVFDFVVRTFRFAGFQTYVARNYTDIDDKIIHVAQKESKTSEVIARFFQHAYDEEMKELSVLVPDEQPTATETIPEMIQMIEVLIQKGNAYVVSTRYGQDVYFRIRSFPHYGKLSKRKKEEMISGDRVELEEGKEDPQDFALWKAAKPSEPFWESPWGRGRPGWHIECSAMIRKCFGEGVDIHMGGMDLIFPHHENEIAQSESLQSVTVQESPLARYWLHNGLVEFEKEKMSKSLGNMILTRDFLKNYGSETLRLLIYQQHYRSPIDASLETILRAEALVLRLYDCKKRAIEAGGENIDSSVGPSFHSGFRFAPPQNDVEQALFDDFNSAKALGFILAAARECYRDNKKEHWKRWGSMLPLLNHVFGLLTHEPEMAKKVYQERKRNRFGLKAEVVEQIENKLKERDRLRKTHQFDQADEVRKQLEKEGILVMDGVDGSIWTVKENSPGLNSHRLK